MIFGQQVYDAGIYLRLSQDDDETGESASIATQRMLIRQYCMQNDINIRMEYCDDGYSGTNFERPNFQKMIGDIKAGKINLVVVKDLSRFGRNFVDCSFYTDKLFDDYNVRFIAISDGVDTLQRNGSAKYLMPIKNLFNSMHPQETSTKTIDALDAKARNGEHTASKPPYGYMKSSEQKNALVIDEGAAEIVRNIFALAGEGKGYNKIAKILTEKRIPSPMTYFVQNNPGYYKGDVPFQMTHIWNLTTVRSILHNQVYIGKVVHGRKRTKTVSSTKMVKRPNSEWIIADAPHPPIIARRLWDEVHQKLKSRAKTRDSKNGTLHLFAGMVSCKDCHTYMQFNNRDFVLCPQFLYQRES